MQESQLVQDRIVAVLNETKFSVLANNVSRKQIIGFIVSRLKAEFLRPFLIKNYYQFNFCAVIA